MPHRSCAAPSAAVRPARSWRPAGGGLYVASKATAHAPKWLRLRRELPVVSTWIDEAEPGMTLDWPDLWQRCLREATNADVLLVYMEPGETLKGAWIEVGAALAAGVPVIGVGIGDFSIAKSGMNTLDEALDMVRAILNTNPEKKSKDSCA